MVLRRSSELNGLTTSSAMMDNPKKPVPPPRPRVSLATLLNPRPDRGRLVSAVRASMASGLCLLAGWLLGNLEAGLTANAFAAPRNRDPSLSVELPRTGNHRAEREFAT